MSRGGIRWSDRIEDYRTEILGLMKAQQVKNAVIVPSGAKGGFVARKSATSSNDTISQKEGIRCYRTFIQGLLDITDNRKDSAVVSPTDCICKDDEDSYLVVAADKGTATFSDIANSIAFDYDFWLGDAFASGGSVGYDHKKMGITAKGAWIAVQRHFREMHIDVQTSNISVIGIGDMSGDVFGNGMLLSSHIQLLGAFNHKHVFIDPTPCPTVSYQERQRLFNLPRSSWSDYDHCLISEGGGVFSRQAKSIPISDAMRELLNIDAAYLTPNALIAAMLRATVDLLWIGGIGTYIKSSRESNADVQYLRVNGNELRCKVICEGANLGISQLGRIEYALNGGRCNTDFIDNAAGVDCSDHEVNIKIALNNAVSSCHKIT